MVVNLFAAINDAYGDGICCQYGSGSYSVSVDGVTVASGGQFATSESTSFGTCVTDEPTLSPTFTPETGSFYTACGSSAAGCSGQSTPADVAEKHELRCCADNQLQYFGKHSACPLDVWGASDFENGLCHHAVTWNEGRDICEHYGGRLCTKDELLADCTRGSGCSHDHDMIWSSTKVEPPTPSPTRSPTCGTQQFECTAFADDTTINYSVITKENVNSAAHNVYTQMYVGGNLRNPYSQSSIAVDGHVYYSSMTEPINTNFNGGKTKLSDMSSPPLDFEYYEWLATHINAGVYANGYRVIVKTQPKGSCYHMYDFLGPDAQGYNQGKTLIVFTFPDNICLTKTPDGRQFGPSVLAPFSKVTLTNAGFLDGIVIARRFTTVFNGNYGSEQQLHGAVYSG